MILRGPQKAHRPWAPVVHTRMTLFLIHISLIEIKCLLFPFHITIRYPPLLPNPWRNSLQLPLRNYTETTGVFLFAPSTVGVKKLRRAPTFHFTCTRIGYVVVQAHDQHIVGKFHSINLVSRICLWLATRQMSCSKI